MSEKIKIVMIDDEQDFCLLVKANLEDTGAFEVTSTSKPEEAENVVHHEKPDLILVDVVMPGRSGADVIATLKKDEVAKTIPIIVVSGKGEMVYNKRKGHFKWIPHSKVTKQRGELPDVSGVEALAEAYGVNDYISKPCTTEVLIEVIKDVLAKTKKQSAAQEDSQE